MRAEYRKTDRDCVCACVSKMTGGAVRQPQECDKHTKDFAKVKVGEEKQKELLEVNVFTVLHCVSF